MLKLIFERGQELMGKEEVRLVISGTENRACKGTEDKSKIMAGLYLYLRYGWRVDGEDQETMLRSLLGSISLQGPLRQQENSDFILKARGSR